jgi:hypothetical protein
LTLFHRSLKAAAIVCALYFAVAGWAQRADDPAILESSA